MTAMDFHTYDNTLYEKVYQTAYQAAAELIETAGMKAGQILVVGCSTSEVGGEKIGTYSSPELAAKVFGGIYAAVQAAVKLLEWGEHTGLDPEEIREAASAWLSEQTDSDREEALLKLEMVDDAYQRLLKEDARELLDTAGCADTEIFWGSEPVEPVEAIMQAAGLRKD